MENLHRWHPVNETLEVYYIHLFGHRPCFVANNETSSNIRLEGDNIASLVKSFSWQLPSCVVIVCCFSLFACNGYFYRRELQKKKMANAYDNDGLLLDMDLLATFNADAEDNV